MEERGRWWHAGPPTAGLITVQHQLATTSDSSILNRLDTDETRSMTTYESAFLGPLAPYTRAAANVASNPREFAWHCGFIRAARLSFLEERRDALGLLLDHPSRRFLRRIVCGDDEVPAELGKAPPTLDSLVLRDSDNTEYATSESIESIAAPLARSWMAPHSPRSSTSKYPAG